MRFRQPAVVRATALPVLIAAIVVAAGTNGSTQMRSTMKDRITDAAANAVLESIRSSSCSDFAAMLQQRKSSSGGSSSGSRLKNDPRERQRFVNAVAGPLVNKMIDCDLLPGRK